MDIRGEWPDVTAAWRGSVVIVLRSGGSVARCCNPRPAEFDARAEGETFREPLDAIEQALHPDLRKKGINSWLGALMCGEVKWRVYSGSRDLAVPFAGRVMTRASPEGFDHCCEQRVASLSSFRPLWQTVLDMELCAMATITRRLVPKKRLKQKIIFCSFQNFSL